jgi:ATP-dependent Clp protease ATP-binding subunit ClpA
MRLPRRGRRPRAKTIRPAEGYLFAGSEEARRLSHNYVGTEHVLSALVRVSDGGATRLLAQLGVTAEAIQGALAYRPEAAAPAAKIDPQALAMLGIDFKAVRGRLEATFGPGALERTRAGCIAICPRLKIALAYALDHASDRPLGDQDVLLGMLSVPDSVAARVLTGLGVTLEEVQTVVDGGS